MTLAVIRSWTKALKLVPFRLRSDKPVQARDITSVDQKIILQDLLSVDGKKFLQGLKTSDSPWDILKQLPHNLRSDLLYKLKERYLDSEDPAFALSQEAGLRLLTPVIEMITPSCDLVEMELRDIRERTLIKRIDILWDRLNLDKTEFLEDTSEAIILEGLISRVLLIMEDSLSAEEREQYKERLCKCIVLIVRYELQRLNAEPDCVMKLQKLGSILDWIKKAQALQVPGSEKLTEPLLGDYRLSWLQNVEIFAQGQLTGGIFAGVPLEDSASLIQAADIACEWNQGGLHSETHLSPNFIMHTAHLCYLAALNCGRLVCQSSQCGDEDAVIDYYEQAKDFFRLATELKYNKAKLDKLESELSLIQEKHGFNS